LSLRGASIEGTLDPIRPTVEHVRVDHGDLDVLVAEKLLDGSEVVAGFEQVGRE
jgi:hypothetical protein